jgi:RNA polymerase sigma-70 factor (ECF subfamily)
VIGWIMNQARSRAIDRVRFEQRKKRVNTQEEQPPTVAIAGPYETLESSGRARALREALEILTPKERKAIEMAFFSELSYREVAAELKEPIGTVKTRIRSGLGKLRQAFADPGREP